jgi:hypothetical protein
LSASLAFASDLVKFQGDSRKFVKEMASQLGSALQTEMTSNGPAAAIKVYKDLGSGYYLRSFSQDRPAHNAGFFEDA